MNQSHLDRPAREQRQKGLASKIPPVALLLTTAALMWIGSSATPMFDVFLPANLRLGMTLALIGAVTCVAGVVSFWLAKTTVNPMKPDSASSLVVSGIYNYTRNPMYLGLALVLLGWAVFLSNLTAFALLAAFVAYIDRFQIVPEEHALASLFPHEFSAYRARVRRWM